jgi:hypothetical protein
MQIPKIGALAWDDNVAGMSSLGWPLRRSFENFSTRKWPVTVAVGTTIADSSPQIRTGAFTHTALTVDEWR